MSESTINQLNCDWCKKTAIRFAEWSSWLMIQAYVVESFGRWKPLHNPDRGDHSPRHFCCVDCLNQWVRAGLNLPNLPETRNCEICGKQIDSPGEKPIRLEGYSYTVNHEECRLDFSDTIDKPPYLCYCCVSYIRYCGPAIGRDR